MMPIKILDEQLANKIAAGEVIERPASVVKELVENAIDAGATDIEVVIEEAGRKLIQVTDNGAGMSREDAVLSLQRHATSKIASTEDLFAIRTLGFRGEALPSIAAVSHLRMVTRLPDEQAGAELTVHGGIITDLNEAGCAPGTRIEVRQLFYNTPARLKFLKSDQTEFGQIADFLNALSLCHHRLNLRLAHNGREIMARPSVGHMLSNIVAWLGREAADTMLPVGLETPGIRVEGFAGKPEIARANRGAQFFFVNGRRIQNRTLTHALEYPYEGLLDRGRFPVASLRIAIAPEQVDVNVHPAKAEVRFHREAEVHGVLARAVKDALAGVSMVRELAVWQPGQRKERPPLQMAGSAPTATLPGLPDTQHARVTSLNTPTPGAPIPEGGLRAIGQFHNTYLLAEGRDALLLINQHRAHERVIFEQLWARFEHVNAQRLMLPSTLHLGHREAALLEEHLENLKGFGFDIEPLSGQSYIVRAVPAVLASANPEAVLQAILADLEANIAIAQFDCADLTQRAVQEGRRRLLAAIACKAALKAGAILAPREQTELLEKLQECNITSLCPHGDPIMMTITQFELDRKFFR